MCDSGQDTGVAAVCGRSLDHVPDSRSPAIDAGDDSACGATDQRGVKRPLDGQNDGAVACDIGAYERVFVDPGLTLAIALNQPSYGPGDTLAVDVTAANPTGPETPADVYLGFMLPASAGPPLGCAGGDAKFPRLAEHVSVPAALPTTFVDDLILTICRARPQGTTQCSSR
jgi:hypothetical protein